MPSIPHSGPRPAFQAFQTHRNVPMMLYCYCLLSIVIYCRTPGTIGCCHVQNYYVAAVMTPFSKPSSLLESMQALPGEV